MKTIKLLSLSLLAILAASCGSSSSEIGNNVEFFPFKMDKGDKYGLVNTEGKVLFENEFQKISYGINGRFLTENSDGLIEIYSAEEKPQKVGGEYKELCSFQEDVAPSVEPNKPINFIDKDGKVAFAFDKVNGKAVRYTHNFIDGIAIFSLESGLMGCINTSGKVVVEPVWTTIGNIGDGKMIAISPKDLEAAEGDTEKAKLSIIDYNGKVLNTISADKMQIYRHFVDGYALASKQVDGSTRPGIIDENLEWVVKPNEKYSAIVDYRNGVFTYRNKDRNWGLSTIEEENVIFRAKYDEIYIVNDNCFIVKDNDGYRLVDKEEKDITKDSYKGLAGPFNGNFIAQDADHSYLFLDKNGEPIDKKQSFYVIEGFDYLNQLIREANGMNTSETVTSDYVDLEGLVDGLKITDSGLYGYTLNTTVKNVVTKANGYDPESYEVLEGLSEASCVNVTCDLGDRVANVYVEFGEGNIVNGEAVGFGAFEYTLTDAKAKAIKAEIHNDGKVSGKQKDLYKVICAALEKAGWTPTGDERPEAKAYKKGNIFALAYAGSNAGVIIASEDSPMYDELFMDYLSDI